MPKPAPFNAQALRRGFAETNKSGRTARMLRGQQALIRNRQPLIASQAPARLLFATPANVTGLPVGSGYAPGDTITLAGGTSSTAARLKVRTIGIVSATVAAGGSGGTNGSSTLSVSGGTPATLVGDAVAQVIGTISGGALTAISSIFFAGEYTVSPGTSAIAVTGGNLTGATINIVWGVVTVDVDLEGSYSVLPQTVDGTAFIQASTSGTGTGATFFCEMTDPPVQITNGRPQASSTVYGSQQSFLVPSGSLTLHNPADWAVFFANNSRNYYTTTSNVSCLKFFHDGTEFAIMGRAGNAYLILADGVLITPRFHTVAGATGQSPVHTRVVLGKRKRRRIVILMRSYGFYGIATGPYDTVEPAGDDALYPTFAFMTDSYGTGNATRSLGGPFVEAALRLGSEGIVINPVGGSGYITAGSGTSFQDATRIANVNKGTPDIIVTAGGINDSTTGLTAGATAYFAALRAANPTATLIGVSPWGPRNSSRGSAATKRDLIKPGLVAAGGQWIWIDHLTGAVTNSAGFSGIVGSTAGWQTGDGYTGALTGSGNGDLYDGDGTHYNEAGNNYLGQLLADSIYMGINAL